MKDKGLIFVGLIVFLAAVTFPFWYAAAVGGTGAPPQPELPAEESDCVAEKAYMTPNHMTLLHEWRDAVVREGRKDYMSKAFGKEYEMSLTKTCMNCHSNKETFCDRCRGYADVQPDCWNCHIEPKGN
jgi:hypothetical protein